MRASGASVLIEYTYAMRRLPSRTLLALAIATSAWACGSETPTTPSTTPPVPTTETFSGDLSRNGATTHPFTVTGAGTVTSTLTTVSPDSTLSIGMSLGTWNGTSCQIILANDRAVQGIVLTGSAGGAGALCVRLYDIGQLTTTVTYSVTIVHP
jgi:hypothetical protein